MKSKFVKVLQFLSFLLLAVVLLYFAFRGIDFDEVVLQIREANYRWVAFSMFFAILAIVFRAFRWRLLIEPLDKYPKIINIFHAINVGYLANFLFPRIGEITRCGILNRTDKVPADKLFGTVVVERIFDMLMSAFMLCLILIMRFNVVRDFFAEQVVQPIINSIEIGWIIVIIAFTALILFAFYRIFRNTIVIRKIVELLHGVANGIKSVKRLRNFKLFIALSFIIFGMYFLQTYVLFFALESTSSLGIGDALFVLVISAIALILPVQGGIGAYHWIISMGLTIFGLTREEGMVYAAISHSVTSILFIMMGAISLIFVFYGKNLSNKSVKRHP